MVNYKRDSDEPFSGINIVPFTDIVLVLLIIFMIAAPGLVSSGMNVSLPGSRTAASQLPARLEIALNMEGKLYLDNQEVTTEALRLKVAELTARKSNISIVLNADTAAQHGKVIEVLDILRAAGAKNIYVGTVKK